MRVFSIQADSLKVVEGGIGGGANRTQFFCCFLGETTVASGPACRAVCLAAARALSSEGKDEQAHGEPLALDPTVASMPAVVLSKSGSSSQPARPPSNPPCLESKGKRRSLSGNQKQNRGWTLAPLLGSCLERYHLSPQQPSRLSTIDMCGGGQSSPGARALLGASTLSQGQKLSHLLGRAVRHPTNPGPAHSPLLSFMVASDPAPNVQDLCPPWRGVHSQLPLEIITLLYVIRNFNMLTV